MIRISAFIVDPYAAVREGVKMLLRNSDIAVVGSAGTLQDALADFRSQPTIAMILELNIGPARGTASIDTVLAHDPGTKIVVYSDRDAIPTVAAAYKAGARAFVGKSLDPTVLIDAVRKVTSGNDPFYAPGMAEALATYHMDSTRTPDPRIELNNRDFDIFLDLARGRPQEEVRAIHGMAKRTFENRLSHIKTTLGIERSHFTLVAQQFNLVD